MDELLREVHEYTIENMATILIIEDSLIALEVLSIMLSKDHTVLEASNGNDGFRLFEKYRPDLVITDLNLPDYHGLDLIRDIRTSNQVVKIIAFSTFTDQVISRQQAFDAGADACLVKPVDRGIMNATIARLLNRD